MVAGMIGLGTTIRVQPLLQKVHTTIDLSPERIAYSQWQPDHTELLSLVTVPRVEFVKGITSDLKHDSYLNVDKRNLILNDDQTIEVGSDNRIVMLFTKRSHHRNLSVIYIVQN